jgi:hypothetical protein
MISIGTYVRRLAAYIRTPLLFGLLCTSPPASIRVYAMRLLVPYCCIYSPVFLYSFAIIGMHNSPSIIGRAYMYDHIRLHFISYCEPLSNVVLIHGTGLL